MFSITDIWNDVLTYIFGTDFLIMALIVIGAMEFLKNSIKLPEKWSSTILPYIALFLSCAVVYIGHWGQSVNDWILHGLLQAFFVDIFYTYLSKPVLIAVPMVWKYLLNVVISKKTDANNK